MKRQCKALAQCRSAAGRWHPQATACQPGWRSNSINRPAPSQLAKPGSLPEVRQLGNALLVVACHVAAGGVVHERLPPPHQAVEQRALAHVGTPNDGHLECWTWGWESAWCAGFKRGTNSSSRQRRQAAASRRRRRLPRPSSPRAAGYLAARWHSPVSIPGHRPPSRAATSAVAYGPARFGGLWASSYC